MLHRCLTWAAVSCLGVCLGLLPAPAVLAKTTTLSHAECIVPANPGGGWDLTCRTVSKLLTSMKLVDHEVAVTNIPGAGGGAAMAISLAQRYRDGNLIIAASASTSARLAGGSFGDLEGDDVLWLAALAVDYGVVAVSSDSNIESLDDLVERMRTAPQTLHFGGGGSIGSWDHLKLLQLANKIGVSSSDVRYQAFNGGGEALTELQYGNIDAVTGDFSEMVPYIRAGQVKVLAVMSPERLAPPFKNFPTATELGYPLVAPNWRGFYVPHGVSEADYGWWRHAMAEIKDSSGWKDVLERYGLQPYYNSGPQFNRFVLEQIREFQDRLSELGFKRR